MLRPDSQQPTGVFTRARSALTVGTRLGMAYDCTDEFAFNDLPAQIVASCYCLVTLVPILDSFAALLSQSLIMSCHDELFFTLLKSIWVWARKRELWYY